MTSEKAGTRNPRRHHDLIAWQRAVELVKAVYKLAETLPDSERFGLVSQMRRAAVSVPSNIAEGHGRGSSKAFLSFLWIANGSLSELDTQIQLAVRLGFVSEQDAARSLQLAHEVGRMLTGLRRSLD